MSLRAEVVMAASFARCLAFLQAQCSRVVDARWTPNPPRSSFLFHVTLSIHGQIYSNVYIPSWFSWTREIIPRRSSLSRFDSKEMYVRVWITFSRDECKETSSVSKDTSQLFPLAREESSQASSARASVCLREHRDRKERNTKRGNTKLY